MAGAEPYPDGTGAPGGGVRDAFDRRESAGGPGDGGADEAGGADWSGLPVKALGVHGHALFFMDATSQFRQMNYRDLTRLGIISLFGKEADRLEEIFPSYSKGGDLTGWAPNDGATLLSKLCHGRGLFDPAEMMRGRGCWVGHDGELVMNCGDRVFFGPDDSEKPGLYAEHVYAAGAALPAPARVATLGGAASPGADLLALLKQWNWDRPGVDPELLLGWIGAAFLGGALDWRPLCWLTGDAATGKSTLQGLIKSLFGRWLVTSTNATAAGIWQELKFDSRPVALDEQEATDDNRKQTNILELARQGASGGIVLRGGADHAGSSFTARSAFLFSSILIPPLQPQDRSRMAILNLDPLKSINPPAMPPRRMAGLGALMRARLLQEWPRWNETLEAYRQALAKHGLTGRGADQYGTLLAAGDLLLFEWSAEDREIIDERSARIAEATKPERAEVRADWEFCLAELLSATLPAFKGGAQRTVGQWLAVADGRTLPETDIDKQDEGGADVSDLSPSAKEMRDALELLAAHGIMLRELGEPQGVPDGQYVMVANAHKGLVGLFRDSKWSGKAGASGGWAQALGRVQGAYKPAAQARFAGAKARYVAIQVDRVLGTRDAARGVHADE